MKLYRKTCLVIPILLLLLLSFLLTAGCAGPSKPIELNVSIGISLTDALKDINNLYMLANENVTIVANFGAAGTLQKQIEQGAPADVFISAAAAQMDALEKGQLLRDETRQNLLTNKVVLIVPKDSALGISSFNDLADAKVKIIAVGDPQFVAAGAYAYQVFDELGITARIQPKEVLGADVRQVLTYVEGGNVDAGIVFATDALTSKKVKVVAEAPADINARVVYSVAVVKASKNVATAKAYVSYLFSVQAKTVFEKYGFSMAGK
jgi:molybdate transport system substrate-binding protein